MARSTLKHLVRPGKPLPMLLMGSPSAVCELTRAVHQACPGCSFGPLQQAPGSYFVYREVFGVHWRERESDRRHQALAESMRQVDNV